MRIFKYLIGIWTAVAVYTVFAVLSGPSGISAYNHLLAERERQWANIRELNLINEELERSRNNLLYDHDTLLVHARQMGYGYEDERFIRIVGLGNIKITPAAIGKVYITQESAFISSKSIKIIAICAGLLIFTFFFMLELIEKRTQ